MSITLSGTRINVEYLAGDPKGDSWANPWTLEDIYQKSIADGWSPAVQKLGTLYYCPYSIYFQGTDTYFVIAGEKLEWSDDIRNDVYCLMVQYIHFKITYKSSNRMSSTISNVNTGYVYLADSISIDSIIQNTTFNGFVFIYAYGGTYKNVLFHDTKFLQTGDIIVDGFIKTGDATSNGIQPTKNFASNNNIKIVDCQIGILHYYVDLDLNNIQLYNNTYDLYIYPRLGKTNTVNYTDSKVDFAKRNIYFSYTGIMNFYNKSTFKINIIHGDGGIAELYDQFGNLVFSETLSGELTKIVTFEQLHIETDGSIVANDYIDLTPFKLVISKSGYADLIIPGITITAGDITEIFGEMEYPDFVVSSLSFTNCTTEVSNDGTITVAAQGGSGNYEYSKDGGTNWQTSGNFTGLVSGDYDVLARDTTTLDEIVAGTITISVLPSTDSVNVALYEVFDNIFIGLNE